MVIIIIVVVASPSAVIAAVNIRIVAEIKLDLRAGRLRQRACKHRACRKGRQTCEHASPAKVRCRRRGGGTDVRMLAK
jgi:hypothetical protein